MDISAVESTAVETAKLPYEQLQSVVCWNIFEFLWKLGRRSLDRLGLVGSAI